MIRGRDLLLAVLISLATIGAAHSTDPAEFSALAKAIHSPESPESAASALSRLESLADAGDSIAMMVLGAYYGTGLCTPSCDDYVAPDAQRALYWLTKADEKGAPAAKIKLATHYALGVGVPKDTAKAQSLMESAARNGSEFTTRGLAMYYMGEQQYQNAIPLFEQLIGKFHNPWDEMNLGGIYYYGWAGEKDLAKAVPLLEAVYQSEDSEASEQAAGLLRFVYSNESSPYYNPNALLEIAELLAERGKAWAHMHIAQHYLSNDGYDAEDYKAAIAHANAVFNDASADEGYRGLAASVIASALLTGRGVAQDAKEAIRYLELARERAPIKEVQRTTESQLAFLYLAVDQNEAKAFELYALAAEKGDPDAMAVIAELDKPNGANDTNLGGCIYQCQVVNAIRETNRAVQSQASAAQSVAAPIPSAAAQNVQPTPVPVQHRASAEPGAMASATKSGVQMLGKAAGLLVNVTLFVGVVALFALAGAAADPSLMATDYSSSSSAAHSAPHYREVTAAQASANAGECTSDFDCGSLYVCVKGYNRTSGNCARRVNANGTPTVAIPNPASVFPNQNEPQCHLTPDCPIGFRCDISSGRCMR